MRRADDDSEIVVTGSRDPDTQGIRSDGVMNVKTNEYKILKIGHQCV